MNNVVSKYETRDLDSNPSQTHDEREMFSQVYILKQNTSFCTDNYIELFTFRDSLIIYQS